jgi:galactokinase
MLKVKELKEKILCGGLDDTFARLYGEKVLWARERYLAAIDGFVSLFGEEREMAIFSSPGRTEIGGNHTDHNGGRVLAGSVNLDVIAVVSPTDDGVIHVHSKGYNPDIIDADDLEKIHSSIKDFKGVSRTKTYAVLKSLKGE